jgi:hypothetical protein
MGRIKLVGRVEFTMVVLVVLAGLSVGVLDELWFFLTTVMMMGVRTAARTKSPMKIIQHIF